MKREKIGNFVLDLAKLIFGGIIIGGIMGEKINPGVLYGLGMFFFVFAMTLGFVLIDNSEVKGDKL